MNKFKKNVLSAVAVIAVGGLVVGCDDLTTPDASPIISDPVADVNGTILDATTAEPIVGARIIVEGYNIQATTDENGQYMLKDVPDTVGVQAHFIAIDMTSVTSPVAMSTKASCDATTTTCNFYPDAAMGRTMAVAGTAGVGGTSGIGAEGFLNVANYVVGKTTGAFTGHVYDIDGATRVAGIVVMYGPDANNDGEIDIVWGTMDSMADDTTTADVDETGMFKFESVEAGIAYAIAAKSKDNNKTYATTAGAAFTLGENIAVNLDTDINQRVVLMAGGNTGPNMVAVSLMDGDEVDPAADLTVSWSFDEAIATGGYADTTAVNGDLNNDVTVTYDGARAGNVAHTIAWVNDRTTLAITIPAASLKEGSKYTVDIGGLDLTAATGLVDSDGNGATNTGGIDTSIALLTTGTDIAPATVATVTVTTVSTAIDFDTTTLDLDWTQVSGVASYNVYMTPTIGGTALGAVFLKNFPAFPTNANLPLAGGADWAGTPFVTDANEQVTYTFQVAGVNAFGTQGTLSAATSASQDGVAPTVAASTCANGGSIYATGDKATVTFSEPVLESDALTMANYSGFGAAISAEYDPVNYRVTFEYDSANGTVCVGGTGTVTGIKDIAGNTMPAGQTHTL